MDTTSKNYHMLCCIRNYRTWDDTLNAHVEKFHSVYGVYPNIALAAQSTWDKIDSFANKYKSENIIPPEGEFEEILSGKQARSLCGFSTPDYSLDLCIDETVNNNYLILVFDEDPTFDGETISINNIKAKNIYKRVA